MGGGGWQCEGHSKLWRGMRGPAAHLVFTRLPPPQVLSLGHREPGEELPHGGGDVGVGAARIGNVHSKLCACVRACVRAGVRLCMCVCVCVCVCVCSRAYLGSVHP